ncbi:MAG: hypothetical protein ACREEB_06860 [Caulobacteraceae bacterium]
MSGRAGGGGVSGWLAAGLLVGVLIFGFVNRDAVKTVVDGAMQLLTTVMGGPGAEYH